MALCAVYSIGLGRSPLLDPDEPIYGQFVKEMVATGNWLTPHYGGHIWFDKPPLFYWLSSICVKVLGLSAFSVRLPSAIFAALTVVLVYLLASYDFGKRAGYLASAVAATALLQIIMSHAAATDAIMVFFMVAGLLCYRYWLDSTGKRALLWMVGCGAAAGFGMLAKGPVVPVLLTATFVVHLIWIKQIKRLWSVSILAGIAAALMVGLPWYLAMLAMHGKLFVNEFILANNLTRFTKPLHPGQSSHWYSHVRTLLLLFVFFFPWSVFLPQAIKANWRSNTGARLAISWTAVVIAFFSLSRTQNFTYSFPAFPACAVLVGAYLGDMSEAHRKSKGMVNGVIVGLAAALLIAAAIFVLAKIKYPQAMLLAGLTAGVMALVYVVPAVSVFKHKQVNGSVPWKIAGGMIAFNLVIVSLLFPQVAGYKSSEKMARLIESKPPAHVTALNLWRPGLMYYLDRPLSDITIPDVKAVADSPKPRLIVCKENDEKFVAKYDVVEICGSGDLDVFANRAYMRKSLKLERMSCADLIHRLPGKPIYW